MAHARRFFTQDPLAEGQVIHLPDPLRHRLKKVLRLGLGDSINLWNGKDGLWACEINHENLKTVHVRSQVEPQTHQPQKHLFMALTKRDAWETILRQATEMGITDIHPVVSDYAERDKTKAERVQLICTEAAEQCERLDVPHLHPVRPLKEAIKAHTTRIFWAAEREENAHTTPTFQAGDGFLIGPEGGFSESEKGMLQTLSHVVPISLGPLILKADTAASALIAKISL